MDAAVIINPAAGIRRTRGAVDARVALARRALLAHGVRGAVFVTERPGHGFELAGDLVRQGVRLVVAWGGDGTVNEAGSALAFQPASLGIVPGGSGNGLARELGLDPSPEQALAVALTGANRRVDAGELGGRLFFNVAGIGLDAYIASLVNAAPRRGLRAYLAATWQALLSYAPAQYTLALPDEEIGTRALFVALANSRQYGFGARIAPAASVEDGLLDVVVVGARPVLASLWQVRRLFDGSIGRAPGVVTRQVPRLTVTSDGPMLFHVDGECVHVEGRVTARAHAGALLVKVR